ncbi:MAG: hypothetical protein IPG22_16365 [Acidobacteria bacterium]|nr:hypothetical protein [Acidobacteriota bacterium]
MPNLRSKFKTDRFDQLPLSRTCNKCGKDKMRDEMIIQHRHDDSGNYYYFRPRCKDCNNSAERGHRREYKTKYLQNWRKQNAEVNESYWRNDETREAAKVRARSFSQDHKDAIAIQRRLYNRGEQVTIAAARELLALYGRCYPTRYGLTLKGLKRCEQIRSRLRSRSEKYRMLSSFEIRVMVYEESEEEVGLVIPPEQQPIPYPKAAENLRNFHQRKNAEKPPQEVSL